MIEAWHFAGETLRDGSPVPVDGVWIEVKLPLIMCEHGLHWSRDPFDALTYAPGPILCRVQTDGEVIEQDDKGCSTRRLIVARRDATDMLRSFARWCALSVIDEWDAPQIVREYLETGDESKRAAAWDAARDAAWDAARDAARAAAWDAARDAARAAARAAAWAAAWDAARDAAWDAARADAARDAARAAARAAQRAEFNRLVMESFSK